MSQQRGEFKGFGLGFGRRVKDVLYASDFKGFGFGFGRRLKAILTDKSADVNPAFSLSEQAEIALATEDYAAMRNHIAKLSVRHPEEEALLMKWFRQTLSLRHITECEDAAMQIYKALPKDHPRTKKILRQERVGRGTLMLLEGGHSLNLRRSRRKDRSNGSRFDLLTAPARGLARDEKSPAEDESAASFINERDVAEASIYLRLARQPDAGAIKDRLLSLLAGADLGSEPDNDLIPSDMSDPGPAAALLLDALEDALTAREPQAHRQANVILQNAKNTFNSGTINEIAVALISLLAGRRNRELFRYGVRKAVWLSDGEPSIIARAVLNAASVLGPLERHYLLNYSAVLEAVSEKASNAEAEADDLAWVATLQAIQNWGAPDIAFLKARPSGGGALSGDVIAALFGNAQFCDLVRSQIGETSPIASLMQIARQALMDPNIGSTERYVAATYLLSMGETSRAAQLIGETPFTTETTADLRVLLSVLRRNPELLLCFETMLPHFVEAAASGEKIADDIMQLFSNCGAVQPLTQVLEETTRKFGALKPEFELIRRKNYRGEVIDPSGEAVPRSVCIVTDLHPDENQLTPLLGAEQTEVYFLEGAAPSAGENETSPNFFDSSAVNDNQVFIRELTDLAEIVAYSFTKRFIGVMNDAKLKHIFSDLEAGMFASVRARAIGILRRYEIRRHWKNLVTKQTDRLVLLTYSPQSLREVLEECARLDVSEILEVQILPRKRGAASAFASVFKQGDARSESGEVSDTADLITVDALIRPETISFEAQLRRLAPRLSLRFRGAGDRTALFINRLSAKTVPATVAPVMRQLLDKHDVHMLEIRSAKEHVEALSLEQTSGGRENTFCELTTMVFLEQAKDVAGENEDEIKAWFEREFSRSGRRILGEQGVKYFEALSASSLGFDLQNVVYLMSLQSAIDELFDRYETASVYVCPGRSAEAYVAQTMAARRNIISIDIVNAWMSEQYTYATPRGDIVTAIDDWTERLLMNAFQIDSECVVLTGTPRYDGFYQKANGCDRSDACRALGVPEDKKHICVALQPVSVSDNLRIINGVLSSLNKVEGYCVILKPHPRETNQRLTAYQRFVDAFEEGAVSSKVAVLPKSNILDALSASDLCITAFSNVGVEAALSETDTILCQFEGMDAPIRLDEMGLGYPVQSEDELCEAIVDVLNCGEIKKLIVERRSEFFAKNAHFVEAAATQTIVGLSEVKDLIGHGERRPLLASRLLN